MASACLWRLARVLGSPCVKACLRENLPLPDTPGKAVRSLNFRGTHICCSTIEIRERDLVHRRVELMVRFRPHLAPRVCGGGDGYLLYATDVRYCPLRGKGGREFKLMGCTLYPMPTCRCSPCSQGGSVARSLQDQTTHLICGKAGSEKFEVMNK
jgi:hypothetical protein